MRHIVRLLVVFVCALLVISCGSDEGPSINDVACSLTSIAINPASSTIAVGGTQRFDLQGTCSNGDSVPSLSSLDGESVLWTSSNPNVAVVDTGGNARGVEIGSAVIQAELGTWTATAVLTVNMGRTLQVVVIEPTLATVLAGATKQLRAVGRYSDGTDTDLTDTASWSSDDTAIATVDEQGEATGVTGGSTIVRAAFDGKAGVASLEVIDAAIESLEVAPPNATIVAGETQAFTAMATLVGGGSLDVTTAVTWTSSNSAVATIDAHGTATGLAPGTITVAANVSTASDTASLTISPPSVTEVHVTPATAVVYLDGPPISFVATAQYSDGSSGDVTQSAAWTSSKEYIATVGSNGMATPLSCVGATAISATYQGVSGSATLQVGSGPELIAIELEPVSLTVPAGMNLTIEATGVYSDSSTKDISQVASWSSSDPSIAVVDTSYSAAVTGVSMGVAQVTASLCGLKSQPAEVTVGAPEIIGLQIKGTSTYLTSGCPGRLEALAYYSDGSQGDATDLATWSSSNTNVVEVLNQPAPGLLIATGSGSAPITAQVQGWFDTTEVVVNSGAYRSAAALPKAQGPLGPWRTTIVGIIIEPKAAWSPIHGIVGFRSWTIFSNNDRVEFTTAATWSSDQPTIATMDQIGVATALAGGNTTIQASFAGIVGTASFTVVDATLKSMTVVCDPPRAQPGVRLKCKAFAEWEDGNALDVGRVASWSSSDPDVVAVTGGNLTAFSPGLATIAASHAGQTDSVEVEVLDAQLVEIQVVPPFATIPLVQRQEYQAVGLYSDGPPQMLTDQVVWTTTLDHERARVWGSYPGTASVHAELGGVSTEAWLEVLPIVQTGVKVIPSDAATFSQHRTEFAAVAQYEGGYRAFVTPRAIWGGSANVANFDPGPGVVTGAAPGSHSVAADFCFAMSNAQVTVSDAQLTSITVTPSTAAMHRGTKTQYRAFGSFNDGSSGVDITNQVAWTTTDKNVAVVNDRGTVTARDSGAAEVRATFGRTGVQGATTLTVDGQATLDRIYVWFMGPGHQGSPTNPTTTTAYLPLGGQVQARAMGVFINGSGTESFQDLTEVVTWSSAAPERAMPSNAVGERGLVTAALDAAQVGSAAIQALYDDGTTVVLSSNQASLTVTACDAYASFGICELDANDVCAPVSNVVVGKNLPVSLGAIATFDGTAAGCQGLDQKGYFATRASIWSPADGTVALVANQHRAGEVIAVGPGGAQTQLTAHWTGTSPAVLDSVTVEVGP